jgi:hypothetical protein
MTLGWVPSDGGNSNTIFISFYFILFYFGVDGMG